jgi:hypothetical protein
MSGSDIEGSRLTQVNMCHGSKKMIEAINHITYVEPSETIIEKKVLLVKSVENVNELSATSS